MWECSLKGAFGDRLTALAPTPERALISVVIGYLRNVVGTNGGDPDAITRAEQWIVRRVTN